MQSSACVTTEAEAGAHRPDIQVTIRKYDGIYRGVDFRGTIPATCDRDEIRKFFEETADEVIGVLPAVKEKI